jgi:rhodanese-related sulfurtransferase
MKDAKRQVVLTSPARRRLSQLGGIAAITALIVVVLALAACQAIPTPSEQPAAAPTAASAVAPAAAPAVAPTAAPAKAPAAARPALPAEVSVADAAAKRDAGAFILDVRTPDEWKEFHVLGSTLIPLDELPNRLAEVPKDKEIVVVCRSGNRSATGRDALLKAGYPQVTSLAGGLTAWRSAGKPVEPK